MPTGGEPNKLGNRYEEIWTVWQLLKLISGDATEIVCEPLVDQKGIEFRKTNAGGESEAHSVKYTTTQSNWTPTMLTKADEDTGRSILSDLIDKVKNDAKCHAWFVSQISANDLQALAHEARQTSDLVKFKARLNKSRKGYFADNIVPLCQDEQEAYTLLKRIYVETLGQTRLIEMVGDKINEIFYAANGTLDREAVRLSLGEFILEHLSTAVKKADVIAWLKARGYEEKPWAHQETQTEKLDDRNRVYRDSVTRELINRTLLSRQEARDAVNHITQTTGKYGIFLGTAGQGKSCALADLLDRLKAVGIPTFALRLDTKFTALTPLQLGRDLDFPNSPVHFLGAMANGQNCVLMLDQLDALSVVSGRLIGTLDLLDQLLAEAAKYPKMRVWLACRDFDLEYDPRLKGLVQRENPLRITMAPLTDDVIRAQIRQAGVPEQHLSSLQMDVLRTPMHLGLYLEGDPANQPPFKTVLDLYDRYWNRKQDRMKEELGRPVLWVPVIDYMCNELSSNQTLSAPTDYLDTNFREDVRMMVSANVLVLAEGQYRFFHEGFFDYAFARQFAQNNRSLVDVLKDGEQHLFRRAQVRQILGYLRELPDGRKRYLKELSELLNSTDIRTHLVKMVTEWLATVNQPTMEEAKILGLHE